MKRYLIFSCDNYYPFGGFDDFKSDFDSKEEVVEYIQENNLNNEDSLYIVDIKTRMKWGFNHRRNLYNIDIFMEDSKEFV